MNQLPVLIAGAGPTGLMLALWLTKAGIPVRIIDKADRPGTTSRAIVVHARTLEFYRQLGIDQTAISRGIEFKAGNLWVKGRRMVRLPFGYAGKHISPYAYALIFPQDLHEQMLAEQLEQSGVRIERNTGLVSFEEMPSGVRAQIRHADDEAESYEASYIAGCDGAHSVVRHKLNISFPGGTYENMFYVADLKIHGPIANGEMNAALDDADFLIVFPMPGEGRVRLVGAIKPDAREKEHLQWADVSEGIIRRLKMEIEEVKWFSTYHVHHRVSSRFRQGRAFLLGDAGHIHSPVGGQGMNTGIGDAVNLAWKLAEVLKGNAPDALLDTYEPERIAFARRLVATTDRVFTFVDQRSKFATAVRTRIVPWLLRLLFRLTVVRRTVFRLLSQTTIHYRQSALSKGRSGRIQGGDRLPWIEPDNFKPLAAMNWQLHCYGTSAPWLQQLCAASGIPLHVFPWNKATERAGIKRDATYVVRPDGYIGLVVPDGHVEQLRGYLRTWCIHCL